MDSIAKSAVIGRLSGPIAWLLASLLYFFFDVCIDDSTQNQLVLSVENVLTVCLALYGTVTPVISKIRQAKKGG